MMQFNAMFSDFIEETESKQPPLCRMASECPWDAAMECGPGGINKFVDEVNDLYESYGPVDVVSKPPHSSGVNLDAEVGDDHAALTDSPVSFLAELAVAREIAQVKISDKDTFVSSKYLNFAEDYLMIPENWGELWKNQMINSSDLPYLDIPKVRTMIPSMSKRVKHSDTIEGKISLVTKSARFAPPLMRRVCDLACALQYVSLNIMEEKKFPFLPSYLGGMDAHIPGKGDGIELSRYISRFHRGNYSTMIYTIAYHVSLLKGGDTTVVPFLARANEVVTAWRTWYTRFDKYLPSISGTLPPEYTIHKIGRMGSDPIWTQAAERLHSLKAVATETDVLIRFQMCQFTNLLLSSTSSNELRERLSDARSEMKSSTIFTESWKSDFNEVVHGFIPTILDVNYLEDLLSLTGPGQRELRAYLSSSIVYENTAIDETYFNGPLFVDLGMLRGNVPMPIRLQSSVDEETELRIKGLLNWLRNPSGYPPSHLLDDDPLIVKTFNDFSIETRQDEPGLVPVCILFSEDRKLAALMNSRTGDPVVLVSPVVTGENRTRFVQEYTKKLSDSNGGNLTFITIVDHGSDDAVHHRRVETATSFKRVVFNRFFNRTSEEPRRLRLTTETFHVADPIVFDKGKLLPTLSSRRRRLPFAFKRNWSRKKDGPTPYPDIY